MLEKFRRQDWLITIILAILGFISLVLIFSTTFNAQNLQEGQDAIYKQLVFLIFSFGIYFLILSIDLSWLNQRFTVIAIYTFILLSLIYVITLGDVIQETQRWVLLGPFSYQPAEFAKLALVIATSYIFTHQVGEVKNRIVAQEEISRETILALITATVLMLIYTALIFIQPSLGNALITMVIWAAIVYMVIPIPPKLLVSLGAAVAYICLYFKLGPFSQLATSLYLSDANWKLFSFVLAGITFAMLMFLFSYKKFALLFVAALLVCPGLEFGWNNILKEYHRERVEVFANGFNNSPQSEGYQVRQSIIAIGSGQLYGQGYMQGRQSTNKVLPYAHTDFIFAALAEQFGFLGVITLFALYSFLIYRIFLVYLVTNDRFGKLIILGCICILLTNIFIHVSINMGLIPVTGVPLPLISYGGSSVLLMLICMGIVQMVKTSTKAKDFSQKLTEKFVWDLS